MKQRKQQDIIDNIEVLKVIHETDANDMLDFFVVSKKRH